MNSLNAFVSRLKATAQVSGISTQAHVSSFRTYAVISRNAQQRIVINDLMTLADAVTLRAYLQADDVATMVDVAQSLGLIVVADAAALADAVTMLADMSVADAMTLADDISVAQYQEYNGAADVASMADAATVGPGYLSTDDVVTMFDQILVNFLTNIRGSARPGEFRPGASMLGAASTIVVAPPDLYNAADVATMADAVSIAYLFYAADAMASADAVTMDGSVAAADTMTAADAQAALGSAATTADGMATSDAAADTTPATPASSVIALLHLNEGTYPTRPPFVVNSAPGGLTFGSYGQTPGTNGGTFWFDGSDMSPFGLGMNMDADGGPCAISSTAPVTFAGDFCLEGFITKFHDFDEAYVFQISDNGTLSSTTRVRLLTKPDGDWVHFELFVKLPGVTEFLALSSAVIAPLAGVAAMPTGYHYALVRDGGLFKLKVNGAQAAAAVVNVPNSITGYLDMYGGYDRPGNSAYNGSYQSRTSELRATNGSPVYTGTTYTIPTARFPNP